MSSTSLLLSSTKPVIYQTAKKNALQLISSFSKGSVTKSTHYPLLTKKSIVDGMKDSINNRGRFLGQGKSSLCGPASFFFTLLKIRPDIYVQLIIDIYSNGKTTLKDLKLESSQSAKNLKPVSLREVDWLLLSSIKPKYDHPDEQFDGITLPGKLKKWFIDAGFTDVVDNTNLISNKGLETLLKAQNDYSSGYTICLFVDADIFYPFKYKSGSSFFPNHWVVMNSDVKIRKYNEKTKKHEPASIITQPIISSIKKQISDIETAAFLDDEDDVSTETYDRILLDAFTWGKQSVPVTSKISSTQEARLSYFLNGFYGYIKVKR